MAAAMVTDDALTQFMALTEGTSEEASHYLEMANGNLEDAVNLFLEFGGGGSGPPRSSPVPAPAAPVPRTSPTGVPPGVLDADVAAEVAAVAAAAGIDTGPLMADAHMADADEVRAPIRAYEDQMINPELDRWRLQQQIDADSEAMDKRMRWDAEAATGGTGDDADGSKAEGGQSSGQAINELFAAPPFNDRRPWYEVLRAAKEEQKWILVNIQQAEVFASHQLNRDVWREGTIVEIITNNFLFWQRDDKSAEGVGFCSYYNCGHQLPHICVIDPRTGRRVKAWDGRKWVEPHAAAEYLFGFQEEFSLERSPVGSPSASPGLGPAPAPQDALPTSQDVELCGLDETADDVPMEPAEPEAKPEALPDEPSEDQDCIKVSLRLPSGQRATRRFLRVDPVERLFQVASALSEKAMDLIEISTAFPKRSLRDIEGGLQALLKDADVAGSMVNVTLRSGSG
mmetsp:Transcript_44383/g.105115  ORF Transcript_44383/g.105115 Transcript_44383/m.105115 type:complete len:456 (-) Transcript_44383:82-1449(-)